MICSSMMPDELVISILPSCVRHPPLIPQKQELAITVIVAGRLLTHLTVTVTISSAEPNKIPLIFVMSNTTKDTG